MKKQLLCPYGGECPYLHETDIQAETRLRPILYVSISIPSEVTATRQQTCLAPRCNTKFSTCCPTQLFCSVECYQRSGWTEKWDRFLTLYANDLEKLKRRMAKERYRQTEKGQDSRRREYVNRKRPEKNGSTVSKKRGKKKFYCLRPGCGNMFSLTRQTKNRCYCSRECRDVMRDKRRELRTTHCPIAYLVLAFLKLMKPDCIFEE